MSTSRDKALERYRRYNNSAKGTARRRRYEESHPERATRWSPIMLIKARNTIPPLRGGRG